ncbi:MAG: ABC transporter ATP-binding protein, partial [Candidatus Aminicenantes bacterium]|nr:ABC transporter ATP-binding protein [Candidatus Aminicenantes bacterium]
ESLNPSDPYLNKSNNMNAIEIIALKKFYPVVKRYRELLLHPFRRKYVHALNGVDLTVESGKCFCLLGPNGAGKTTLIKILSTLVLPDEGTARVNGWDVVKDPNKVKANIGVALNEERSFYWRLTGRQNLDFFADLNGLSSSEKKDRLNYVFQFTGLEDAADSRFNTYSTGMKQMLALARALLIDARVLFVDEPTRSLDPKAAQKVRRFLREELVDKQGRTVFWATHNLMEAQEMAHKLAVIDHGIIKAVGKPSELTQDGKLSLQEVFEMAVE